MRSLGWRETRNHVGTFYTKTGSPIHIGIKGFPDWTFTRGVLFFHLEVKRPGLEPEPLQYQRLASLNHLGEIALWADSLAMLKLKYPFHDT